MKLSTIRKAVTAEFGALLLWAQLVPDFTHLGRGDYIGLAVAVGTGFGVYGATNDTAQKVAAVFTAQPATSSAYVPIRSDSLSHTIPADPPGTHAPAAVAPAAPILP